MLLVVLLWVLAPIALGRVAPLWDADGFFVPYYTLVADFARAGRLLMWNPWTNGGSPDWIEPNVGALSPTTVLSAALTGGGQTGYRLHWLALWCVAALGVLVWARRLGVPPAAGLAVALGFALSGPFTGNAEHLSFLHTLAFMPFVLERLDAALVSGRLLTAAQAGALWGLSALGGYPGLVLGCTALIAVVVAGRIVAGLRRQAGPDAVPRWRALVPGLAAGAVAGLVMPPAIVPMLLEGPGFTDRAHALPRDVAIASNALAPMGLVTAASPYLATLPPALYWPGTDVSSVSIYVGALSLFLAVFAIASRPRDPLRYSLLAGALFLLALALGPALPLRGWVYDLVPPTRFFRHASMLRMPAVLALVLLALHGVADLFDAAEPHGWRRAVAPATGILAAVVALATYHLVVRAVPAHAAADRHAWIVWTGVAVVGCVAALRRSRARTQVLLALLCGLAIYDAHRTFAFSTTTATPALAEPWRRLEAARVRTLDLLGPAGLSRLPVSNDTTGLGPGPTNKNLLLRRPVFVGYAPMTTTLHQRWAATPALAARVLGADRVFFAKQVVREDPGSEAFDRFASAVAASGRMPLVVHDRDRMHLLNRTDAAADPGLPGALERAPPVEPLPVGWRVYDPDRLSFEIDAPDDGWVLVTERWARGWRAAIDGAPVPVQGGNFLFRALPVARGRHVVEMWYRPAALPWLLVVSWGTLAAVLTATLIGARRGTRSGEHWPLAPTAAHPSAEATRAPAARRAPDSAGRSPAG